MDRTNPLGMTFDEVVSSHCVTQSNIGEWRSGYRDLMCGGDPAISELRVDLPPVVRTVTENELTKFVQRTSDGLEIESVIVPMHRKSGTWSTLCVSSQVGCARACGFCETAQLGLLRNLTAGEIVGEVVTAQRELQCKIRNVVFMGMGEPFDNFDEVIKAIRVITDPAGASLGMERIAISTVGRLDGIRRLAQLGWRRINLAISLNAPNDEIRSKLMPNNRREPMAALRQALLGYPLRNCQYFMIEYVLIPGVNNAQQHAAELSEYLKPLKCIVNVIPYNPRLNSPWRSPTDQQVNDFIRWLKDSGQECRRRLTKGRTGMAACGQLGNRNLQRAKRYATGQPEA